MWEEQLQDGILDYQGNKLYLADSGNLILRLNKSLEKRIIGRVAKCQGEEYIEIVKPERQILLKNNSWGFNWELISHLPSDMVVVVRRVSKAYKDIRYKLTVAKIKELGGFLHFLGEGFERQIFVPINQFYQDKK